MRKLNFFLLLFVAGLLASGCHREPTPATPGTEPQTPDGALPKLRTIKLWLGAEELTAELAATPEQLRVGMMFRTNLEEDEGMLFLLGQPTQPSFWMKDTPLALSAAFLDPNGNILEFHDFQPRDTNPVVAAARNVQYVLETRSGWFERHHIAKESLVRAKEGSLPTVFAARRTAVK